MSHPLPFHLWNTLPSSTLSSSNICGMASRSSLYWKRSIRGLGSSCSYYQHRPSHARVRQDKIWSAADVSPSSEPSMTPTTPSSRPLTPPKTPSNLNPWLSAASPKPFQPANFKPEFFKAWLQEQSRTTIRSLAQTFLTKAERSHV